MDTIGRNAKLVNKKNKLGVPNREIETRLMYLQGFDNDWTNLRLAKKLGVVEKSSRSAEKAKEALVAGNWKMKKEEKKEDEAEVDAVAAAVAAAKAVKTRKKKAE